MEYKVKKAMISRAEAKNIGTQIGDYHLSGEYNSGITFRVITSIHGNTFGIDLHVFNCGWWDARRIEEHFNIMMDDGHSVTEDFIDYLKFLAL